MSRPTTEDLRSHLCLPELRQRPRGEKQVRCISVRQFPRHNGATFGTAHVPSQLWRGALWVATWIVFGSLRDPKDPLAPYTSVLSRARVTCEVLPRRWTGPQPTVGRPANKRAGAAGMGSHPTDRARQEATSRTPARLPNRRRRYNIPEEERVPSTSGRGLSSGRPARGGASPPGALPPRRKGGWHRMSPPKNGTTQTGIIGSTSLDMEFQTELSRVW